MGSGCAVRTIKDLRSERFTWCVPGRSEPPGSQTIDSQHKSMITAIPELIKALEISGCIITIDAIGTQTKLPG